MKVGPLDGNIYELDFVLPRGSNGRDGINGKDGVSNIPGPVGPRGRDGVDGRVVIGQVVGGISAVAAIHVADDTQIIDLVLPRGPEGAQGPRGETGPKVRKEFPVEMEATGKIPPLLAREEIKVCKASKVRLVPRATVQQPTSC